MPVTLTPLGELNGPNNLTWPGERENTMSSQPLVLVLVRYQIAVPDAVAVRAPTQTHLFSEPGTHASAVMLEPVLGTIIATVTCLFY